MNRSVKWNGQYKGFNFEIHQYPPFASDGDFEHRWTFYLFFALEQFPETARKQMMPVVYYTSYGSKLEVPRDNPIENFEWHGGLTYISVQGTEPFTFIKAGCDYQHLWDMHKSYCEKSIENDVKECIDSIYKNYPDVKTYEQIWEEFRKPFPGNKTEHRTFDKNATPIDI